MKTKIFLFLIAIAASQAFARIGESPEQCQQRYGAPFESHPDSAGYHKSGFIIGVSFYEGKVVRILYRKVAEISPGTGGNISDNDIEQFLKLNAGKSTWNKPQVSSIDNVWHSVDGSLYAVYRKSDNSLTIATKGYYERLNAAMKAKQKKTLQGF